jgi:3'-phosphoadenosine 5'-phosphosulfate sulfotransferase (PAPS reductase)/FAD synthetase
LSNDGRVVVWFSCGAASACAAKIAVEKYPECHIVYCDTLATEHPDNSRFLADVEKWIGKSIEVIRSTKYESVDEVFEKRRYMSGVKGAICTTEMKKIPRYDYQLPNDLHIFGMTADEQKRIDRFESSKDNRDLEVEWVLRDAGITKEDCYQILRDAGIDLPKMYGLGFKNNNCIGCVKSSSSAYWNRVRRFFPDVFKRRCEQSRAIGARLIKYHGKRIFLDELPQEITDSTPEQDIDCGVICLTEENTLVTIAA